METVSLSKTLAASHRRTLAEDILAMILALNSTCGAAAAEAAAEAQAAAAASAGSAEDNPEAEAEAGRVEGYNQCEQSRKQ